MSNDSTDERYELSSGLSLHAWGHAEGFSVWLNASKVEFSGVFIGSGKTRKEAIDNAIATLNEAQARLMKER